MLIWSTKSSVKIYKGIVEGVPSITLELTKTPKPARLREVVSVIHRCLLEHKERVMFIIKHVKSEHLDVIDIPTLIDLVRQLLDIERDTNAYIIGTVMRANVDEFVMCAKQLFCTLKQINNFDIVSTEEEVFAFVTKLK
jgi:hypothetical protein